MEVDDIFRLFLLTLARVGGLVASAPILGSANFPIMAKAGLSALTAGILTSTLLPVAVDFPEGDLAFGLMAGSELLIGLAMGFVMTLTFAAIQVGGQIIDLQTGFGVMNVFNPALEVQFPIFGFFLFILAVLFLLITDGHHLMLRGLVASYDTIPPGGLVVRPGVMLELSRWGRLMFYEGLMIAGPVGAAMLLAYVTMGLLGRLVPQIHLFVVGFPITIATGLLVFALVVGIYVNVVLEGLFHQMFRNVDNLIRGLGQG